MLLEVHVFCSVCACVCVCVRRCTLAAVEAEPLQCISSWCLWLHDVMFCHEKLNEIHSMSFVLLNRQMKLLLMTRGGQVVRRGGVATSWMKGGAAVIEPNALEYGPSPGSRNQAKAHKVSGTTGNGTQYSDEGGVPHRTSVHRVGKPRLKK